MKLTEYLASLSLRRLRQVRDWIDKEIERRELAERDIERKYLEETLSGMSVTEIKLPENGHD